MKNRFCSKTKKCMFAHMSPEEAVFILEKYNNHNRRIDPITVEKYSQSMIMGKWTESNDSLTFDYDGNLLNGQHRLQAVVKSGKTIEFDVKYGLHPSTQMNMDRLRRRSLSDALILSGNTTAAKAAISIATNFYRYENKWIRHNLIPDSEIAAFLEEKQAPINSISAVFQKSRAFAKIGFLTALAVYAEKNETKAVQFGKEVIKGTKEDGTGLRSDDAAFRLREYLLVDRGGGAGKILENAEKTFYAIHYYVNNLSCKKLGRKTKLEI